MAGQEEPRIPEVLKTVERSFKSANPNNNLSVFSGFTTHPPKVYTKWSDKKWGEKRGMVTCCTEKDETIWLSI